MDGRYAQLHWCGESYHCYPQPDCKHFFKCNDIPIYFLQELHCVYSYRFCEYVSDWALHSLWVYLWGDAPEGQHLYWKTGQWSISLGVRGIRFIIRLNKKRLFTDESHLCLRISAPAQQAGPHWARSRLWRQRSTPPATGLARRRGSSVNLHFSHISTVQKVLLGKSTCIFKFCCINYCLLSCLSVCIKQHIASSSDQRSAFPTSQLQLAILILFSWCHFSRSNNKNKPDE